MKRELIVFVLFLLVNVSLSVNCVFFHYAGKQADYARGSTTKAIIQKEQSERFSQIREIKLEGNNPYIVHFYMLGGDDLCLDLINVRYRYQMRHLQTCPEEEALLPAESKWAIDKIWSGKYFADEFQKQGRVFYNPNFPDSILIVRFKNNWSKSGFERTLDVYSINPISRELLPSKSFKENQKEFQDYLEVDKDKLIENKFNVLLHIQSSNSNQSHILLFSNTNFEGRTSISLLWDKNIVNDPKGEYVLLFWELIMQPIGLVADIATLPFQFFIGVIYFMVNGIK